ncbi:MAG: hypothetical protein VB858_15765 [Planctomycetaceae bacterium]
MWNGFLTNSCFPNTRDDWRTLFSRRSHLYHALDWNHLTEKGAVHPVIATALMDGQQPVDGCYCVKSRLTQLVTESGSSS